MAHLIQTLVSSAVGHLHATAALVRKAALLHNGPPYSLCRTAVETGANAYWLLEAPDQKVRLGRHLQCVRQDTFDFEQVSRVVADRTDNVHDTQGFDRRRKWANAQKDKHNLTGLGQLKINQMMAEVDAAIAASDRRPNDHHMETYWKSASGAAHGRQWATIHLMVREQVIPMGNATATLKVSNTESRVFWGVGAAHELLNNRFSFTTPPGHQGTEQAHDQSAMDT